MPALGTLVRFFGRFRVSQDNDPRSLRIPRAAIPVLAYCALHAPQSVKRRDVAFALWPDHADGEAQAKLRRILYKMQKAAPEAALWLSVNDATMQWSVRRDLSVDLHRFQQLLSGVGASAEAAQLYDGDLLADFDGEWLDVHRERFRSLHLANLKKLIIQSLREGRNLDAQTFCARFLACDPWNEEIVRFAMRARYASGDRAGALRDYDAFAKLLGSDLQARPSPETLALHELIAQDRVLPPVTPAAALDVATSAVRTGTLPFAGREGELKELLARWALAAAGETQFAVLSAEAGIGKTRLAYEFASAIEAQGGRVMMGGTARPERSPYQALSEALESQLALLHTLALEPQTQDILSQVVPSLAEGAQTGSPLLQDQLHEAIAQTLMRSTRKRPLLLILEDLQWAGAASIEALNYLMRRWKDVPICVLVTYRTSETPRTSPLRRIIRRNRRERAILEIALEPLDTRAVSTLLHATPFAQEEQGVRDLVCSASGGNPLFVGQIVDACRQRPVHDQGALLQIVHDAAAQTLRDFVERRFETLAEETRRATHVACVIGTSFDAEVLTETLGWNMRDVYRALDELLDRKIIREAASKHHAEYAFTHDVLAATLYDNLSEAERSQRHLRIAHVLRDLHADRQSQYAQVLAFHYARGGEGALAATYYLAAACNALRLFANDDARAMAELGLELVSNPAERAQLLLVLDEALHRNGDFRKRESLIPALLGLLDDLDMQTTQVVLERAAAYFRAIGAPDDEDRIIAQVQSARVLAAYHLHRGNPDEARWHAQMAATQCEADGDIAGLFESRRVEFEVALNTFDFEHAKGVLESLASLEGTTTDPGLMLQYYHLRKMFAHNTLAHQEMAAVAGEWMEYARKISHLPSEVSAALDVAQSHRYLQRYEEAGAVHDSILPKLAAINDIQLQIKALGTYAQYWVDLGVPERCRDLMLQARRIGRFGGDLRNRTVLALNLAITAEVMRDMGECERFAREALLLSRQLKNVEMEGRSLIQLACAQVESGNADAAIALVHDGMRLTRIPGRAYVIMMCLATTAAILAKAGDLDTARRHADEALSMMSADLEFPRNLQDHYFHCAFVRHMCGEEHAARELIERSFVSLEASAAALPQEWRARFITVFPAPQIIAAKERNEWPRNGISGEARVNDR